MGRGRNENPEYAMPNDPVIYFTVFSNSHQKQWRRSQVKSGGINIEKIEGVWSGEGLCPPQLGVWGLAAEKN